MCGHIIYNAFKDIADRHGFPPTFSSIEIGTRVAKLFIGLPAIYSLVAESGGRVAGAIFLDEGDPIRGVAIVAVDQRTEAREAGRRARRWDIIHHDHALQEAPPCRATAIRTPGSFAPG